MRHRNRFHSNTLVFCSVQLFFFLSFARHVAKNIESINRDQRGCPLASLSLKKSFYMFRTRFSPLNLQLLSIQVRKQIVERQFRGFSKQRASLSRGPHTWSSITRKRRCEGNLDFVRQVNLGRCWAVTENKTGCFVIRISVRQKSLKPESS